MTSILMTTFTYKTFPIIGRKRSVIFLDEGLKVLGAAGRDMVNSKFDSSKIVAFRCGIKWIRGFEFTIGREYQIFLQDVNGNTMKINFRSLYGYNRKQLTKLYSQILDQLWNLYFSGILDNSLQRIRLGETVEICGAEISREQVTFKTTNFLKSGFASIPWQELDSKDYATYYALYSKTNPADINRGFYYLDDWNAHLLRYVVEELKS